HSPRIRSSGRSSSSRTRSYLSSRKIGRIRCESLMLLLDTCCLLWLVGEQHRLSARARQLIAAHADSLFISAITGFEIALKQAKGRLVLPLPAEPWLERALVQHSVGEIPVTWRIAARSATLPPLHADPCDRIIV